MGLEEKIKKTIVDLGIGTGKYIGRLGLDAAVIYGTLRIFNTLDHEHAMIVATNYIGLRYVVDAVDGIFWRQGRLYDYLLKPATDLDNHLRKD